VQPSVVQGKYAAYLHDTREPGVNFLGKNALAKTPRKAIKKALRRAGKKLKRTIDAVIAWEDAANA
jgi:hypothetical protein